MTDRQKINLAIDADADEAVSETSKLTTQMKKALRDVKAFEEGLENAFTGATRDAKELVETLRQLDVPAVRNQMRQVQNASRLYGAGGVDGMVEDSAARRRSRDQLARVERERIRAEDDYNKTLKKRTQLVRQAMDRGQLGLTGQPLTAQEQLAMTRQMNRQLYQDAGRPNGSRQKGLYKEGTPEFERFRTQMSQAFDTVGADLRRDAEAATATRKKDRRAQLQEIRDDAARRKKIRDDDFRRDFKSRQAGLMAISDREERQRQMNNLFDEYDRRGREGYRGDGARRGFTNYQVDRDGLSREIGYEDNRRDGAEAQRQAKRQAAIALDPRSSMDKSMDNLNERANYKGGAGLFRVQASLMANYAAMSGVIDSAMFLGNYTVELEASLAELQAIASATDTEMDSLSETIMDTAENSNLAANEITQAATVMAQAGLSAKNISDALPSVINLAIGTGTSLADTVDVVTSTLSVFQLQTSQTAQVADVLTAAMNKSKLGIDKFALGVQYSGNIANQQNITYNELAAALGGMADSGIRAGSTLGTGLRQLLIDLQTPTNKARENFERLGLTMVDLDVKTYGLFGVLRNLRDAGFDSADAMETFEVRAAAAYSALVNDLPAVEALNREILGTTAATTAAAVQMDTLSAKFTQFQNVVGNAFTRITEPLREGLKLVLDFFNPVISGFAKMVTGGNLVARTLGFMFNVGIVLAAGKLLARITRLTIGLVSTSAATRVHTAAVNADTVAMNANTAATAANTTAKAGATGAMGRFLGLMKPGPLMLVSVALVALTEGMKFFKTDTEKAAEELDELGAELNEMNATMTETDQELNSVRSSIDRVIDRSYSLTEGSSELKEMIRQLTAQFGAMGLELDGNAKNADDLLFSLSKLETKLIDVKRAQLLGQGTILEEQYTAQSSNFQTTLDQTLKSMGFSGTAADFNQVTLPELSNDRQREAFNRLNFFDGRYNNDIYANQIDITDADREEIRNTLISDFNTLTSLSTDVAREIQTREALLNAYEKDTPELVELKALQDRLNRMTAGLKPLQDLAIELEGTSSARNFNQRENSLASLLTSGEYKTLLNDVDDLRRSIEDERKVIEQKKVDEDGNPIGYRQRREMLEASAQNFLPRQTELEGQLEDLVSVLSGMSGVTSSTDANAMLDGEDAAQNLARTGKALRGKSLILDPEAQKRIATQLGEEAQLSESEIALAQSRARRPDRIPFAEADAALVELLNKRREEVTEKFIAELRAENIDIDTQEGRIRRDTLENKNDVFDQTQRERLEKAYRTDPDGDGIDGFGNAIRSERQKELTDAEIERVRREIAARKKELTAIRGTVDSQSSPEQIAAAMKEWEEVFGEYATLRQTLTNLLIADANYKPSPNLQNELDGIREAASDESGQVQKRGIDALQNLKGDVEGRLTKGRLDRELKNAEAAYDNFLDTLNITTVAELDQAAKDIDRYIEEMIDIATQAFAADPSNKDRLDNPEVKARLAEIRSGMRSSGTEDFLTALGSYSTSREREASEGLRGSTRERSRRNNGRGFSNVARRAAERRVEEAQIEYLKEISDLRDEELTLISKKRAALELELSLTEDTSEQTRLQGELNLAIQAEEAARRNATQAVEDYNDAVDDTDKRSGREQFKEMVEGWKSDLDSQTGIKGWIDGIDEAFGKAQSSFGSFFKEFVTGSMSAGEAFKGFALSVVDALLDVAAEMAAAEIFKLILSSFSPGGGAGASADGGSGFIGDAFASMFSSKGKAAGGKLPGDILNRDSMYFRGQPGEIVMRKSAVDMIGEDRLLEMNALGNRRVSETAAAGVSFREEAAAKDTTVNLWAVTPDQVPPPSKNDIIVAVGENIQNGGSIKKMIKSIQTGSM
jgi:TP901 family phage tail tape measure protein